MRSIVAFELKKIVARRVTQAAVGGLFAVLVLVFALNVLQQSSVDERGEAVTGTAAIAQEKARAEAHAGAVTDERATEDIRAYQRLLEGRGAEGEAAPAPGAGGLDPLAAYENEHAAYLHLIMRPWMNGSEPLADVAPRIDAGETVRLYDHVAASIRTKLEASSSDWGYAPSEAEYWMQKHAETQQPVAYGYAGGWEDVLACVDFLFFAIVAMCVAIAPVFAGEYQEKTDAVVLATRNGKSKLVAAKIVAAFLFATAVFALYAAVAVGVPLAFFGADGAGLPLQSVQLAVPYDVTMAQAAAVCVGIAYLVTLGMTGFALLLSAKLRSPLAIFAICMAVVVLPIFLPSMPSGAVNHAMSLFPMNALGYANLFSSYLSFAFGPAVLDLQSMVVLTYAAVLVVAVPCAARAFRRHQVL